MIQLSDTVYHKLSIVSADVRRQMQKKGIAIPDNDNLGNIVLGAYTIIKSGNFYSIINKSREIIVDKINLPQTAIILANDLAVGKFLNNTVLNYDRNYGYADFEEKLHVKLGERNLTKNVDYADVMFTKGKIKREKKESCKKEVLQYFEKLCRFV